MAATTTLCAHCGLNVTPARGDERPQFCCNGCEAIYNALFGAGLGAFYQERARAPQRAVNAAGDVFASFDDPEFTRLYVTADANGSERSVELFLEGVHCAACVWVLEKLPVLVPGVLKAELSYGESLLRVTWDDSQVALSSVARTLANVGYPPHPADARHDANVEKSSDRILLARIGVAGATFGNVMLLSFALYSSEYGGLDMGRDYEEFFRWGSLVLTIPSVLWTAWPFFRGALLSLRTRSPHLDLPIGIGIAAALIWGSICTATRGGDIYFDSVTMLVFLLLVGRLIQSRQQRYARRATDLLLALAPSTSRLVEPSGVRVVPTAAVPRDALVEVHTGESIGIDGVVESGTSNVDESLLTGESRPRRVNVGDQVSAGTVNVTSLLRIRACHTGHETRLAKLVQDMERASERRAPVVLLADRLSARFVTIVLSLASVTFLYWLQFGVNIAVDRAVSLLIVTCPCALGLATPLAASAALGKAAKGGLLVKGMKYLELMAAPGLVVFDKTGTLTAGTLSVVDGEHLSELAPFIVAAESSSAHPVARALVAACTEPARPLTVMSQREGLGLGVFAEVRAVAGVIHHVHVGSAAWLRQECGVDTASERTQSLLGQGLSPVYVAVDGQVRATLGLGDPLRSDTPATLAALADLGYQLAVLSGDRREVVEQVVAKAGVRFTTVLSEQNPEQKLAFIEQAAQHAAVYMVGDGVNDAAALRAARVGIAICGGAEASLAAADVFSTKPGLRPVLELAVGARRTMRTIRRNMSFSLSYNIVAAVLAVTGHISPLIAAILMPLSSLTVLTNSYRAKTFRGVQ